MILLHLHVYFSKMASKTHLCVLQFSIFGTHAVIFRTFYSVLPFIKL